jgi:hypothetical protein
MIAEQSVCLTDLRTVSCTHYGVRKTELTMKPSFKVIHAEDSIDVLTAW